MWHGADAGYGLLPKEPSCPHARARAGWALRASSRWRIGRPGPHFYILATAPPGPLGRAGARCSFPLFRSLIHEIFLHHHPVAPRRHWFCRGACRADRHLGPGCFMFTFLSYNSTTQSSDGFKTVTNAQLRKGYRNDQSDKAQILIGYVNEYDNNRWFYLPLLMTFNGIRVKP